MIVCKSLRVFLIVVALCPDRIHAKHSLGYGAMLDHSAETLTLLDQSSQDVRPVEDFNGVPYPSLLRYVFWKYCVWLVSGMCGSTPQIPSLQGTCPKVSRASHVIDL